MVNSLKLKGAIIASGLTQAKVAQHIGISTTSLHKKINNVTEFKASEIATLVKLLEIHDITSIFFNSLNIKVDFKSS